MKKKNYNLNVEGTKNNKVFIVAKYKNMLKVNKLSFITETGNLIDRENCGINKKGYILLATIQSEPILRNNNPTTLTRYDILIAKKIPQKSNPKFQEGLSFWHHWPYFWFWIWSCLCIE